MIRSIRLLCSLLCLAFSAAPLTAQLPPVPFPAENPPSEPRRILGKLLFWEEQLSSDNRVSCGTCHVLGAGGAEPRRAVHPGLDGRYGTDDDIQGSPGTLATDAALQYQPDPAFGFREQVTARAAPSVIGAQWSPQLFWDGRATDQFIDPETGAVSIVTGGALESQAVGPILSPVEMGHVGRTWDNVRSKLQSARPLLLASNLPPDMASAVSGGATYPALFQAAFGDSAITAERIAYAIATYERTLVADQTPYDLTEAGLPGGLTSFQEFGLQTLRGTLCLNCHVEPLFTDHQFHNIGLRPAVEDLGREAITGDANDRGRFKTAGLRNVGLRPALMHVGWIRDATDALDFYNAGTQQTGRMQFTDDQTGAPVSGGGSAPYDTINVPPLFSVAVADFLTQGLTDPRVAAEVFPFDRPTLFSERAGTTPAVFGQGATGSGGIVPQVLAHEPLILGSPSFKLGIRSAAGGALALLVASWGQAPPGSTAGNVPLHVDLSQAFYFEPHVLAGSGSGQGYTTVNTPVAVATSLLGTDLFVQWFVVDASASGNLAATAGVRWELL